MILWWVYGVRCALCVNSHKAKQTTLMIISLHASYHSFVHSINSNGSDRWKTIYTLYIYMYDQMKHFVVCSVHRASRIDQQMNSPFEFCNALQAWIGMKNRFNKIMVYQRRLPVYHFTSLHTFHYIHRCWWWFFHFTFHGRDAQAMGQQQKKNKIKRAKRTFLCITNITSRLMFESISSIHQFHHRNEYWTLILCLAWGTCRLYYALYTIWKE